MAHFYENIFLHHYMDVTGNRCMVDFGHLANGEFVVDHEHHLYKDNRMKGNGFKSCVKLFYNNYTTNLK